MQKCAQEGRSYALVCALVAWATYVLVSVAARPTRGRWALYGGTMPLASLLHEFAVLALVAHGVTLFLSRVPRTLRGLCNLRIALWREARMQKAEARTA